MGDFLATLHPPWRPAAAACARVMPTKHVRPCCLLLQPRCAARPAAGGPHGARGVRQGQAAQGRSHNEQTPAPAAHQRRPGRNRRGRGRGCRLNAAAHTRHAMQLLSRGVSAVYARLILERLETQLCGLLCFEAFEVRLRLESCGSYAAHCLCRFLARSQKLQSPYCHC